MFPPPGPTTLYSRDKYPKQLEFFAAGATHNERALLGGNRSGKTVAGAYEMTLHLTARYPDWWKGRRFDGPVNAWACGDTSKTVRDILQKELLGPPGDAGAEGTGLIPGDLILNTSVKHGLADAYESVRVRHASGGNSVLHFKSYDQGREAFQGTSCEVIWPDEEPPIEIYTECLLRTMTVKGIIFMTATPLRGLSEVMLQFLPELQPTAA